MYIKANIISKNHLKGDLIMLNEYSEILTVEDVMEILNIGKNAAYDLFRNGEIKCFRLKNRWKVPKRAVIDYINNQSKLSTR